MVSNVAPAVVAIRVLHPQDSTRAFDIQQPRYKTPNRHAYNSLVREALMHYVQCFGNPSEAVQAWESLRQAVQSYNAVINSPQAPILPRPAPASPHRLSAIRERNTQDGRDASVSAHSPVAPVVPPEASQPSASPVDASGRSRGQQPASERGWWSRFVSGLSWVGSLFVRLFSSCCCGWCARSASENMPSN